MSLMDVLRGMANGPHGQPAAASKSGGGMSPLTMGLLALLAYKALKRGGPLGNVLHGEASGSSPPGSMGSQGNPLSPAAEQSGGLSDWLRGMFGGTSAGTAAGSVLSGGLGELLKTFQQNGHGQVAQSWIGTGPNRMISPEELERAAGADTLDELAQQTGTSRKQLIDALATELPRD